MTNNWGKRRPQDHKHKKVVILWRQKTHTWRQGIREMCPKADMRRKIYLGFIESKDTQDDRIMWSTQWSTVICLLARLLLPAERSWKKRSGERRGEKMMWRSMTFFVTILISCCASRHSPCSWPINIVIQMPPYKLALLLLLHSFNFCVYSVFLLITLTNWDLNRLDL